MTRGASIPRAAGTDWPQIAALFAAGLLAAAQFSKIALLLTDWSQAFGRPVTQISVAVSLVSITGVLFGALAGGIVARIGPRRALLWALALGAALSAVQAADLPFWVFMATRLVEGASHLAIVVAAPTAMAAAAEDRTRPVVMGVWGMFFGVSFALSAVLYPWAVAAGGLPAVTAGHAAAMIAVALVLWRVMPTLRPHTTEAARPGAGVHRIIYSTPRLVAPALGFIWHTLTFVALLTFLPPLLPRGAGVILPLVALIGTFGAGVLARSIAPHRIALASFAVTILLAAAILVSPAPSMLPILALFVSLGAVPGASFAAVPHLNISGADQARANGAIAQLGNVGTALSTPLFAVALTMGDAAIWAVTAALAAAGFITVLLIHRKIAAAP